MARPSQKRAKVEHMKLESGRGTRTFDRYWAKWHCAQNRYGKCECTYDEIGAGANDMEMCLTEMVVGVHKIGPTWHCTNGTEGQGRQPPTLWVTAPAPLSTLSLVAIKVCQVRVVTPTVISPQSQRSVGHCQAQILDSSKCIPQLDRDMTDRVHSLVVQAHMMPA